MSEDALYSRFNARGRKGFKPTSRQQLAEKFPDYGKVGLPAHKAAIEGNVEAMKEIYCAYADEGVPSRDVNGATPLHLAVRGNRLDAVKWLLRFTDLSPTTAAKHGETPCHVAAVLGNADCLKAMLGTDVKGQVCTATDNSGFTALHLATVKSRNEISKLLINELGAKGVGAVNESGITAAHVAASSGNTEVLKVIASKHKKFLSQEAADGTTPLYFAAQEGRLGALKFLFEKGKCDLSYPSSDGRKPIHAACQCGHTHVVKYIVAQLNNSAIFETSPDGATPLHFATSTGMIKTARWLIDSDVGGSLVKMKDSNGDTAAHDAADNGQIETLKLLLESGADLYAINNDGNTPYSLALSGEHPEMANFVMTYASNAPQKQDEGPSQMTIFDMQGEVDVVNFGSGVTGPPKKPGERTVEVEVEVKKESPKEGKGDEKRKSKKKKEKEKKEKEKKEKGKKKSSSSSFLGAAGAALLSLPPGATEEREDDRDDKALDMTAEEMEMFDEQPKPDGESSTAIPKAPPSSDGSDIVVSYGSGAGEGGDVTPPVKSKLAHQPGSEMVATTDYSTVAELAMVEEKKKKKGRQSSKSIQTSLKPGEESAKNLEGAGAILSGPQLGFKPQFRSNPLHNLAPQPPPTPPPTPATGISSSAPSDAGLVSTEDEDDTPYDMYTKPEQEGGGGKSEGSEEGEGKGEAKKEKQEGGQQLEENVVTDLDAGEGDEGEKEKEEEEEEEEEGERDEEELKEKERHEPSVTKKWPPPASEDYKPSDAKVQPSGVNVLKKWPPSSGSSASQSPSAQPAGRRAQVGVTKKWPPTASLDPEPVSHPPPPPITKQPSPPAPKVTEDDTPRKLPVQLRSVQKAAQPSQTKAEEREVDKVKLKKATKAGALYSSPSTEATSGAGKELMALLKVRQQKI